MVLISAQVLDYQDFLANTSNIDLLSKKWQIRSKSVMVIFGQNENGIGQSSLLYYRIKERPRNDFDRK